MIVLSLEKKGKASMSILVLNTLNESTFHMVDEHHLSMMKEDTLIVNMSRDAVIHEAA